jgi:hypothetical protein
MQESFDLEIVRFPKTVALRSVVRLYCLNLKGGSGAQTYLLLYVASERRMRWRNAAKWAGAYSGLIRFTRSGASGYLPEIFF